MRAITRVRDAFAGDIHTGVPMSTLSIDTNRNGINVGALQETIEAIKNNPAVAQTEWSVHSRWVGGTRSDHQVNGCKVSGQEVDRAFTIRTDEPLELCGSNQYANPQEYLMASINACMMVGYAAVAALMGVKLTRLEVTIGGDIDLRGFLGLDPSVSSGYDALEQTVTIAGDGTEAQFRQIHETVKKTSPNYFNITHAVATNSRLVIG